MGIEFPCRQLAQTRNPCTLLQHFLFFWFKWEFKEFQINHPKREKTKY